MASNFPVQQTPGFAEAHETLTGTTPSVDCSTSNYFSITTSGNTTFSFTSVPASGNSYACVIELTAGGAHTITWPATVDWESGSAPSAPASGEVDIYTFVTRDGGATWYGFLTGDAMA